MRKLPALIEPLIGPSYLVGGPSDPRSLVPSRAPGAAPAPLAVGRLESPGRLLQERGHSWPLLPWVLTGRVARRLMERMEASDADADAVARFREGDEGAFRTLVERHSRGVFRLAYRMTGNEQDAEDVVQEAFL